MANVQEKKKKSYVKGTKERSAGIQDVINFFKSKIFVALFSSYLKQAYSNLRFQVQYI